MRNIFCIFDPVLINAPFPVVIAGSIVALHPYSKKTFFLLIPIFFDFLICICLFYLLLVFLYENIIGGGYERVWEKIIEPIQIN